jgi:hypothetical protein
MGERRAAYRIVVGTHEGRRPLGTPRKGYYEHGYSGTGMRGHGMDSSGSG